MKIKEKVYRVFLIIFLFIFISIIFGTIFDNKSLIFSSNPISLIIGFVIISSFYYFIYKIFVSKFSKITIKQEIIMVVILFLILFAFQGVYVFCVASNPAWDWNDVFTASRLYASGLKDNIDWNYFQMFPNNNGILIIETIMFKLLNIVHISSRWEYYYFFTIIANIICIDLSILLLYLTVRNIFDKRCAIFSIIISITNYAFYGYSYVFYTDTTTMLFPIFIIFLYSLYKKNKKPYIIILLLSIMSIIGYKIKPTILIIYIAIIIDMIMSNSIKKNFNHIITSVISFLLFFTIFNYAESKMNFFPYKTKNNNNEIPYTHWIMMGMTERDSYVKGKKFIGWYNPESLQYTLSYKTTKARKKANIKQIKKQYNELGLIKYISFLHRKMLFTWTDGTYYAPALATGSNLYKDKNIVNEFVKRDGKYIKYGFVYMISTLLFMYVLTSIGVINSIKTKKNIINYSYVAIFGLLLFLLIWEDSSRYLINFIPVLILCTINGIDAIIKKREYKAENIKENLLCKKRFIEVKGEKMKKNPTLYVVVPCYNEEEVLEETTKQLNEKMELLIKTKKISSKSKVMYVNDGSKDKTWELIKNINKKEKLFTGITLSRNRGHQNALLAGLMTAKKYADIVISMDADLQDDINAIDNMIEKYKDGNDIVYGVRSARKKDTFFKRVTAEGFYKFMKVLGVDCVYNHADYRLTSKRVLDEFENYKEVNLFLRGMFPLVGFKSDVVYYERNERFAGESKYPLKKMLNFAWDGITSFSVKPLRLICTLGFLILFISIGIMIYSLIRFCMGATVSGWTFLAISIWFIGGLQMISIGIIGEYIGKMYSETKARPRFIISENLEEK